MSDSKTEESGETAAAQAEVRPPRRLSLVWLVPLATIAVAGWVAYRTISDVGPRIEITFDTAVGLEAGNTKILYKGVQVGTAEAIRLNDKLSEAVVEADMVKEVEGHLNEHTKFWVVRPRVGLSGISGLSTLVSGAYIAMEPGDGARIKRFRGLNEPPVTEEGGRSFKLLAQDLGSIRRAAPVYHRGVVVGEVLDSELAKDGESVVIHILVHKPHGDLVRKGSLFWNASGIHASINLFRGAEIDVESLTSLLRGGVAFANPPGAGEPAPVETAFQLHGSRPEELVSEAVEEGLKLVLTSDRLRGVQKGDSVTYRQVTVGEVLDTRLDETGAGVEIDISIAPEHKGLVRSGTLFWNASGVELDLEHILSASVQIESLQDLVAGGIALDNPPDAGPEAGPGTRFALHAERPVAQLDAERDRGALHLLLQSEVQGSITVGDPVLYREVEVGKVTEIGLSEDANHVAVRVEIEPHYAPLVRAKSVFWNASGIHASISLLEGAKLDVESLASLLRGGVAFATPKEGGPPARQNARFALHREPKKEWQKWAPHIRLPPEPAPAASAVSGAPGGGTAAGGAGAGTGPKAAEGAAADTSSAPGESTLEQTAASPPEEDDIPPVPHAIRLPGGHVSSSVVSEALAKLGFTNVGSIHISGGIVRTRADWQGETVDLHIDTHTGRIERKD